MVEHRSLLAALASSSGSSNGSLPAKKLLEGSTGIKAGRSFADTLRSPSCEVEESVGPQLLSLQEKDLFLVASCFELGYDGMDARSAWDYYEMENVILSSMLCSSSPVKVAALGRRKKLKWLGFICDKLEQILSGWV